ncbi:MAG: hypothetical protein J6V10_09825 [Clostridia bacterium]|nr:hypothetical protein [Clostridia bacterium]MBP5664800.1 hypothetical protein [Clostridia bacterium]
MKRKLAKVILAVVAAAVLAGFALPSLSSRAADVIETFENGSSSKKTSVTLGIPQTLDLQFNISVGFQKAGIEINSNCKDKVIVLTLYKWNKNLPDSKKGEPVARQEFSEWSRGDVVSLDFNSLGVGTVPAGEYVLELYVKEGDGIKVNTYSPAAKGFKGYIYEIDNNSSPVGEIVAAGGSKASMLEVSAEVDRKPAEAPPESVIAEDSMIAQLGVDSTQWAFVDGLGRPSLEYKDAGSKKEKKVGIFYWTWHYNFAGIKPTNVQLILDEYPEARNDYNHKIWKKNNVGTYFWNEPLFGYYQETDDYVLRKHAELLADAGVDFVLFDCTNQDLTWEPAYINLLEVWSKARAEGVKTPQIGFMMPFWDKPNTRSELKQIYKRIYKAGLYQDLWFYLDGKPMVMCIGDSLDRSDPYENEIYNFFTFRRGEPEYFNGDHDNTWWGWLHVYPQALYKKEDGTVEMTTVGVAQNANYKTMTLSAMNGPYNTGRGFSMQENYSYTYQYRGKDIVCSSKMENAHYYGINFQEQWDYAQSVDPEIVFVTGWNEWIAGRNEEWGGVKNGFPDQCDDANSRDIEPSKGNLKDYYYYQLVNNVRRFKGMSTPVTQKTAKTVDITAGTAAWNDDGITVYTDYLNDTYVRDNAKGWSNLKYNNPGTRNDFVKAKVTYDDNNVYFYAETAADITAYTDENWMRLLLDMQAATGDSVDWENFEYIIGRETGTGTTLALEKSTGGWNWEKVGDVRYTVSGNVMQVEIPRSMIGLNDEEFTFNFKWADANLTEGDIMTTYTDGDCAPGGRFMYVFNSVGTVVEEPTPTPSGNSGNGKKGCGSVVTLTFVPVAVVCFAAFLAKKKED